ncbi:MAG: acetate--CoA ligase family protein, partial [Gemmatimonadetes bacterium]|nr:acetate--CoA ligase family protein [Gemmatimonadota bacterium]
GWLSVREARELHPAAGLSDAPGGVAHDAEHAERLAEAIHYPVAVKLASLEIVHKTEIGGVKLGLESARAVRQAFADIRARLAAMGKAEAMEGVLVQPMLEGMAEVMIGVHHDQVFGPVVSFGLGGVHVEILRDVAFGVAPLADVDARRMLREVRGWRLLEGYRGHPPADVTALEEALLRVSRLAEAVPEISEMDLNPIFAQPPGQGYWVVDARIRVDPFSPDSIHS